MKKKIFSFLGHLKVHEIRSFVLSAWFIFIVRRGAGSDLRSVYVCCTDRFVLGDVNQMFTFIARAALLGQTSDRFVLGDVNQMFTFKARRALLGQTSDRFVLGEVNQLFTFKAHGAAWSAIGSVCLLFTISLYGALNTDLLVVT